MNDIGNRVAQIILGSSAKCSPDQLLAALTELARYRGASTREVRQAFGDLGFSRRTLRRLRKLLAEV